MTAIEKSEAAFLWAESMATTVRQHARQTVDINDEFVDVDHFKATCAQLPSGTIKIIFTDIFYVNFTQFATLDCFLIRLSWFCFIAKQRNDLFTATVASSILL